jgi:hypothetical protein
VGDHNIHTAGFPELEAKFPDPALHLFFGVLVLTRMIPYAAA